MPRRCCEWEDVYIKERILAPHCETCGCSRSEMEVRHKITKPLHNAPRRRCSCYDLPGVICRSTSRNCTDCDVCLCYECRKVLGRSEASVRKKRHLKFSRHKFSLLENWFERFDSDGDGFLDLFDLESLLKYLGARMRNSHTKRLLRTCDRDCDGRLSFPEFIHLWQCVALYDEDNLRDTGCCDLSHIIKKYKLYPDIGHCGSHDYHCKHVTAATEYPVQGAKCKCGQREKVIPFIKHESKRNRQFKVPKPNDDTELEDSDKYPVMSLNRDNIA